MSAGGGGIAISFDPETLHEVTSDPALFRRRIAEVRRWIARMDEGDEDEFFARNELVCHLRLVGDLDEALVAAQEAVDRAELIGTPQQRLTAGMRLAEVRQYRCEYTESTLLFLELLNGVTAFGPQTEAWARDLAGRNLYAQQIWNDAYYQFAMAIALREANDLSGDQFDSTRVGLAAAKRHLIEKESDE